MAVQTASLLQQRGPVVEHGLSNRGGVQPGNRHQSHRGILVYRRCGKQAIQAPLLYLTWPAVRAVDDDLRQRIRDGSRMRWQYQPESGRGKSKLFSKKGGNASGIRVLDLDMP